MPRLYNFCRGLGMTKGQSSRGRRIDGTMTFLDVLLVSVEVQWVGGQEAFGNRQLREEYAMICQYAMVSL